MINPAWLATIDIARIADSRTIARGREYFERGFVINASVFGEQIEGLVDGTGSKQYGVTIPPIRGQRLIGLCDCPVAVNCKHVVAVVLALLADNNPIDAPWRRALAAVERERTASGLGTLRPVDNDALVAVQFAIGSPQTYTRQSAPTPDTQDLAIRLVSKGSKGAWVRGPLCWASLEYSGEIQAVPVAWRRPLLDLYRWLKSGEPYFNRNSVPYLSAQSPGLWPLLDAVDAAGVPLVYDKKGRVVLHRDPQRVSVDVTRTASDGLRIVSRIEGDDPPNRDIRVAGKQSCALWALDDDHATVTLHLWRVDGVISPLAQRLIETPIDVPAHDAEEFLADYLPPLIGHERVTSVDNSVAIPKPAVITVAVLVEYADDHHAVLRSGWDYDTGAPMQRFVDRYGPQFSWRQVADEHAADRLVERVDPDLAEQFIFMPNQSIYGGGERRFGPLDLVSYLPAQLDALRAAGVTVIERGERLDYREPDGEPIVVVDLSDTDDRDWFDLAVRVEVDGFEVPFGLLYEAIATGQPLVLPSGLVLSVEGAQFDQLRHLIEQAQLLGDEASGEMRISPEQLGLYEQLVALGVAGKQSRAWRNRVAGLSDLASLPQIELPHGIEADLRPYQYDGFRWLGTLAGLGLGGILADDMGLGKTLQVLTSIVHARQHGMSDPVLVVAPSSVVAGWQQEAGRFAPDLDVRIITTAGKRRGSSIADAVADADVVVTSYTLLRLEFDEYDALPWSWLVLDEAQVVKNHRGKTYQCVRLLDAQSKFALSGTPMENNLMELWALVSIVAPGLFADPEVFATDYRNPIERERNHDRAAVLRGRLAPIMLRRTKDLVAAELPPKQEQILRVTLHAKHRKAYDVRLQRVRGQVLGLLEDLARNRISVLASLTALRQLALSPMLDKTADESASAIPNAKIDLLIERIEELRAEGHRALVFSQFTQYLALVRVRLDAAGIAYEYLDGSTRNRPAVISRFKDGEAPVFLISLKAGGTGLNLTEADYCFVLDPWWNPAVEAQAIDRTHRIGQQKPVVVYRMIAADTIEDKVLALQERKRELFANVVGDGEVSGTLTADDLRALLH